MLMGAGDPSVSKFLDLEIHRDSTIVKFVFFAKMVEGTYRIGDTNISKLFNNKSIVYQTHFDLVGRCLYFHTSGLSKIFLIFIFPNNIKKPHF